MHVELGDLYGDQGAYDEAVEQYRSAAELRPDFPDVRNRLARALMERGDLQASLDELEDLLDENPGYLEARVNLGLVYYRMEQFERAAAEWHSCLQRDPENPKARAFLQMLKGRGAGEERTG
jgi:tetratricopeptide (TPR) repeat protein